MEVLPWVDIDTGFRIQKVEAVDGFYFRSHAHRGYAEIVYAARGRFFNTINGRRFVYQAGHLVLLREDDEHEIQGRAFTYYNVMVPLEWFPRIEALVPLSGLLAQVQAPPMPPRIAVAPSDRPTLEDNLEILRRHFLEPGSRLRFAAFLVGLVSRHLFPHANDDPPWPADTPQWLQDTLIAVSRDSGPPPTLAELVRRCGRSSEHVSRMFRKHIGMTPSQYLARQRIERAANLLATTNLTVREIAFAVGFEYESYFHRVFHKDKEMTPLEYRKKFGPRP